MTNINTRNSQVSVIIFLADVVILVFSLWITLLIRHTEIPSSALFYGHIAPFSFIFLISTFVFFIVGLYGKHTLVFKSKLTLTILQAQAINAIVAVLFFYFIPYFGITPKINLFIYLVISSILIFIWRLYGTGLLSSKKKEKAILVGENKETKELFDEINNNNQYSLKFISVVGIDEIKNSGISGKSTLMVCGERITLVVIDLLNTKTEASLCKFYNLIFSGVGFVDKNSLYENVFDRIPLSLLSYSWFLENTSSSSHILYDIFKQLMDVVMAIILGVFSLVVYPFVWLFIKLDDGGAVFIKQKRVGKNNKIIKIFKFRSMTASEPKKITRIGLFLRKTRIDELPQLWNVLRGDISLIGPRPEIPNLAKHYAKEIPYYNIRHIVKPGLSGWAQIYQEKPPKFDISIKETKTKLSYDFYYIKNRSFLLDIKIALFTLKTLASRTGR